MVRKDEVCYTDAFRSFKRLADFKNYQLQVLIGDQEVAVLAAARTVFGDAFISESCLWHNIKTIKDKATGRKMTKDWLPVLKRRIRAWNKRCDAGDSPHDRVQQYMKYVVGVVPQDVSTYGDLTDMRDYLVKKLRKSLKCRVDGIQGHTGGMFATSVNEGENARVKDGINKAATLVQLIERVQCLANVRRDSVRHQLQAISKGPLATDSRGSASVKDTVRHLSQYIGVPDVVVQQCNGITVGALYHVNHELVASKRYQVKKLTGSRRRNATERERDARVHVALDVTAQDECWEVTPDPTVVAKSW